MGICKNKIKEKLDINLITKIAIIVIWLVPVFLAMVILNRIFVPSGSLEVKYDVAKDSKVVDGFAAKEPDKLIGVSNKLGDQDYFQLITTTPIYFDVKVPRAFAKATVTMKYKNPDNQPKIQLAVKQANEAYYYSDMSLYSERLENLDDHWNKVSEHNVILWQKDKNYFDAKQKRRTVLDEWYQNMIIDLDIAYPEEYRSLLDDKEYKKQKNIIVEEYRRGLKKIIDETIDEKSDDVEFSSIDDFFNNFPDPTKVLKFNYNLSSFLELPGYESSNKITEINKSIRGDHEIFTYLGEGEDLDYTFTIQDSNRHMGEDILTIKVFNNKNELVNEVSASDDGEINANGRILPARRHQLLMRNMPFGTYRLDISIPDDDIFIKKIETSQHLIMFNRKIYLTDNEEYGDLIDKNNIAPTTLYTNSNLIKARTSHENGLQVLRVGVSNLRIDDTHVLNEIKTPAGITPIVSPKNDIYIEGDGFFAFTQEQLFDPNFSLVQNIENVDEVNEYDYILANYPTAINEDGWLVADASIEVPYLYLNEGKEKKYNFIIDLIGLPENDRQLKIKELIITFEKEPIQISNFFSKIRNWYNLKFK